VTIAEPGVNPVSTPEVLIVATVEGVTDHVPPGVEFDNVTEPPAHTVLPPVIAAGAAVTLTTRVDEQPPIEYVIVVTPEAMPVTIPVEPTVATVIFDEDQTPPGGVATRASVPPTQRALPPEIDAAPGTI